jgi:putative Holliday junction resolvase
MRYIGLDLGTRTVGVAYSDLSGTIALADQTYRFNEKDRAKTLETALKYVKIVVEEKKGEKIVLGLPKNMDGSLGFQSEFVLEFKKLLEEELKLEVFLYDERLSSVEVHKAMSSANMNTRKQKSHVDTLSAVLILQSFLDSLKFKNR